MSHLKIFNNDWKYSSMTFKSLGLCDPLLKAIEEQGYDTPTPIQLQTIPAVLKGRDMMASAQTGTGKTAGFTLPLLQQIMQRSPASHNKIKALILAPTRELAAQIHESVMNYGKHLKFRSAVVFGGVKVNPQMMRLRSGVEILVATPGRLLDLYNQNAVKFDQVEFLVLDEADRMLDMGFIHDIKRILALLPKNRQSLLFSATFSPEICELAKKFLHNPTEINVTPRNTTAVTVKHKLHPVDKSRKAQLLSHLIKEQNWYQALVFCRTKHGANKLVKTLEQDGIDALAIHGNKSQAARTKALDSFKTGKIQILVATDIAARGIDIAQLEQVVNYDLPNVPEDYVHRIGRTGRAGAEGNAISLVSADEFKQLKDIEKLIQFKIERENVENFNPVELLNTGRPKVKNNPNLPFERTTTSNKPRRPQAAGNRPFGSNNGGKKSGGSAAGGGRSQNRTPSTRSFQGTPKGR
jgi:ATP-dependent RNA helicase RhlE